MSIFEVLFVLILVFINDLALLNHYVKIVPKKCFDWCSFVTEKEKPKIAAFKGANSVVIRVIEFKYLWVFSI